MTEAGAFLPPPLPSPLRGRRQLLLWRPFHEMLARHRAVRELLCNDNSSTAPLIFEQAPGPSYASTTEEPVLATAAITALADLINSQEVHHLFGVIALNPLRFRHWAPPLPA